MKLLVKRFIIIDDDPQHNNLSKFVLKVSLGNVEVTDFITPESGLNFIKSDLGFDGFDDKVTLFLDINMPSMSGWEFLEKFNELQESVKNHFDIYMVSSSVDPKDIERAKSNPLIIDYLEKPLDKKTLKELFG